jgi:glycine/D-amino acid oxidase-like deaminating enzyme
MDSDDDTRHRPRQRPRSGGRVNGAVEYLSGSGWVDRPDPAAPSLEGDVTCDVAVVGGGLGGMAAALRLAERGADVVLLEADLCGWGASARSAGYLSNTLAADPQLVAMFHRRRFRNLVRFADASLTFANDLIARLSIDCEYERTCLVFAAVTRGQLERARRNMRILNGAGAELEFAEGPGIGLPDGFLGGTFERVGALLNPGKYALGVRRAVLESSTRVFEQTAVRAVEANHAGVTITAPAGRVRAERVLLTTNAGSRELKVAPRHLATPVWTSLVETEPISAERLDETGWTSRAGIVTQHLLLENYRPTQRGTIIFGTRQLRTARAISRIQQPDSAIVDDLVRGFRDRFPSLDDVTPQRAWGGWIGMTTSWLPVAGEADPRVLYAIGCNGHGLAQAPYLGSLLADRIAGDPLHDDLQAVWHERSRFWPSLILTAPALKAAWAIDRLSDRRAGRA